MINKGQHIRFAIVILIALLAFSPFQVGEILRGVLIDAYLSVAVFVMFTLLLIYGVEKFFHFDLAAYNATHPHLQIPMSAALGALPGCGGAIVVITQYVNGHVRFGAMVTVLISTMGDAAFLLLAKEPMTALLVMVIAFVAGCITGYTVDAIHGKGFYMVEVSDKKERQYRPKENENMERSRKIFKFLAFLFFFPGFIVGLMSAFQYEFPEWLENAVGLIGGLLILFVWMILRDKNPMVNYATEVHDHRLMDRSVDETAFITIWVVAAFFLYEFSIDYFGINMGDLFESAHWAMPLIAGLIGLIPGCGPQILVTTFYLNGLVPLSAQIANAISNDGDALFPALAVAPKAGIIATLYSTIPALIIGYGFLLLFE